MLQLAELLHKFLYEIESMPVSEYDRWLAYFRIKERQRAIEEAKQKSKAKSGQKGTRTFG